MSPTTWKEPEVKVIENALDVDIATLIQDTITSTGFTGNVYLRAVSSEDPLTTEQVTLALVEKIMNNASSSGVYYDAKLHNDSAIDIDETIASLFSNHVGHIYVEVGLYVPFYLHVYRTTREVVPKSFSEFEDTYKEVSEKGGSVDYLINKPGLDQSDIDRIIFEHHRPKSVSGFGAGLISADFDKEGGYSEYIRYRLNGEYHYIRKHL